MNNFKEFFCLLICFSFGFKANSQIAYYSAMEMRKSTIITGQDSFKFLETKIDKLSALLKDYLPDDIKYDTSVKIVGILNLYIDNPFFGAEIAPLIGRASNSNSGLISKVSSSLGGISIPNEILLGVTDWIVKRTKQELSVYFFDHFKKQIEKYPDLRTVFPQTYRSLEVLGEEIYNYQRYLKVFRAAFQNDARQLTNNFPSILENHPEFFEKHPELAATLNSGFYVANALQDKMHPGVILNDYPSEFMDPLDPNWKGALQTLQLISASLRDTASESHPDSVYWVSSKQIKELVKDKVAFKIYLGLIYQQARTKYDSIQFETKNGDTTLVGIFDKMALKYDSVYSNYSGFIMHFSEKTNKLNTLIKDHKVADNDSSAFQLYYDYYNAVIDLLQQCTEISKLPFIKERIPDLADTLKKYFDVVHTSADLFLNIKEHNYSSAVANAVHIYDLVKATPGQEASEDTFFSVAFRDTLRTFNQAKGNLLRYGAFLAAISEADKPEEVQKVIETFALPQGSSRIKRQSIFNVSLNAYCGLFVGNEVIKEVDPKNPFEHFNSFGLTAPIGISISKGYQYLPWPISEIPLFNHSEVGWASTWFISLVDLGSVAAYRFSNETAEQVPTIQLGDIFPPGLFWSLGVPKSPLSFTLGAQVGPNLRKVNDTKNDYSNNTYIRYSVSTCVDLPILNLYTKSK